MERCVYSWLSSLPNLEVLKLKDYACEGSEWEPIEGEFCRLKFLHIEGTDLQHWRAEKDHFPRLERLILFECTELEEIPLDFVYLEKLESIDLDDASPSAVTSARQIQAEQQDLGNEVLKVCIHRMWQYTYEKRKEEMKRRRIEEEDRRQGEEEEYRWKQFLWEEYKRRREEARERMRQEEDYRMQEEEAYLQKEYQWSMYQIVPEWYDDDGNSYEQYTSGRRGDYEWRRQEAEEKWRQEADDRWRNGEDANYLRREICWKDYECFNMMVVSSNHRGSETSISDRDELVGKLETILLRNSLLWAWNYVCNKFKNYWRR